MQARVIYVDRELGLEEIVVGSHSIELSAFGEDFCHNHGRSGCVDRLDDEERAQLARLEVLASA